MFFRESWIYNFFYEISCFSDQLNISWTFLGHFCHHFWLGATANSDNKNGQEIFNWSKFHSEKKYYLWNRNFRGLQSLLKQNIDNFVKKCRFVDSGVVKICNELDLCFRSCQDSYLTSCTDMLSKKSFSSLYSSSFSSSSNWKDIVSSWEGRYCTGRSFLNAINAFILTIKPKYDNWLNLLGIQFIKLFW